MDVAASENLYQNAQAAASNNTIARQQNEHAIAVLIGKAPADYSLRGPSGVGYVMPQPPQTIPSQLLERRPDIAQAERQVAKANADIGVATAAYYPDLTLGASGGYASHRFAQWITAPMQYWSLGPQLAMTLFDNGAKKARIAAAGAAYEGMVASYKQTVLTAFQEVEDLLATLKSIDEQLKLQWQTTANTHKMWELTRSRQQSGIASQMDVDTAHIALLTAEAACYSLTSQRMATHIQLIKALGGGVYTPSHF